MQLKHICQLMALSGGVLILFYTGKNHLTLPAVHHLPDKPAEHMPVSSYQDEYAEIMHRMHQDMAAVVPGPDDNQNFLKQMIPHHQGAVEMAEAILKSTTDRRIINLARGIITEQKNEIRLMQNLIQALKNEHKNLHPHEKKELPAAK